LFSLICYDNHADKENTCLCWKDVYEESYYYTF
jgi:hypothetical protein